MTDYSTADDLAAAFAETRPIFAGAFHTRDYSVVRDVQLSDEYGTHTTSEQVVETGRCLFEISQLSGGEGVTAGQAQPLSRYRAELSTLRNGVMVQSVVTERDRLLIDGRTFEVTDTKTEGGVNPITMVELEERT